MASQLGLPFVIAWQESQSYIYHLSGLVNSSWLASRMSSLLSRTRFDGTPEHHFQYDHALSFIQPRTQKSCLISHPIGEGVPSSAPGFMKWAPAAGKLGLSTVGSSLSNIRISIISNSSTGLSITYDPMSWNTGCCNGDFCTKRAPWVETVNWCKTRTITRLIC